MNHSDSNFSFFIFTVYLIKIISLSFLTPMPGRLQTSVIQFGAKQLLLYHFTF